MALTRVKVWSAGDVLTANDLNNEFNNLTNTALAEPFVATQPVDLNGQLLILDADGDTLLDASTNNILDVTVGGTDVLRFTTTTVTAPAGTSLVVAQGDVTASSGNVVVSSGRVLEADGSSVASTGAITVPTTGHTFTITGVNTITSFSTLQVGVLLYVRFTGAGLNITHHATAMIAPWGVDYRTVPNEVLCFLSLGSGNYTFWSVNGPKERVGVTIEDNSTSVPDGYLAEDGTAVSRTTYSGLFARIGTTFGVGDGSTTFNTPLTQGLAVINRDPANSVITSSSTNGANAATLGGKGGAQTHVLSTAEMPAHTHTGSYYTSAAGSAAATPTVTNTSGGTLSAAVPSQGGGGAHSNTQPWIAKAKYIRF